jgi:electron transfer flavoprotein alpha subunit
LEIDRETRGLLQTRPAYGGNIMATIITPNHRPQMATVRHRVFETPAPDFERRGEIVDAPVDLDAASLVTEIMAFIQGDEQVNLADARIIVSGGAGLGSAEGFAPLRELAAALGGAVGASRAAVDAGWIPYAHQVGQTGRTVRPDLYIACGISGAIQHRAGMSTARVIVAINTDPHAPIFDIATYGIVGDCLQIVPILAEQLRRAMRQPAQGA